MGKKCFDLAIKRSERAKLSELRAMNIDILACQANHDTGLHIQQDFTSTMANIVGISSEKKSDDNKENDFDIEKHSNRKYPLDDEASDNEIPVDSFSLEDNDVDEEHEAIYIRAKITSEIKNILKKIVSLKDRILQYRIINLSIRSATNPLHKILSDERKLLKDIWISVINAFVIRYMFSIFMAITVITMCFFKKFKQLENDKINIARYKKWKSEIKPLINTYHNHLEVESVFDDICLDDTIEAITIKPYNGIFVYKKHYKLNWVLMNFMVPINQLLDPEQTEFSYRENFINPYSRKYLMT
ncbi:hypothetical protein GLOIN_2v1799994 [Rhizophagus clarus]|uniref:Uncharacterized protein n=1 Tax=Rhizophagus clarus TaxID=94130 RepID=A0A8H3LKK6_9GLOM|nr:hypothetical protein GLOIN_2v1799994 [Rhizophagus clarus]